MKYHFNLGQTSIESNSISFILEQRKELIQGRIKILSCLLEQDFVLHGLKHPERIHQLLLGYHKLLASCPSIPPDSENPKKRPREF